MHLTRVHFGVDGATSCGSAYHRCVTIADIDVRHLGRTPTLNGGGTTTLGRYLVADAPYECIIARPSAEPELWEAFLLGAMRSYRKFGVERVLEYEAVRTGRTTSMFMAVTDVHHRVVGGVRVQGPYESPEEAHALREWATRPGTAELRRQIVQRLEHGVIEVKTAWACEQAPRRRQLSAAVARAFMHAVELSDVRYALCTGAEHAIPRWKSVGGVVGSGVSAVAYPDERYRTVPMWWDRRTMYELADRRQRRHLEREQLKMAVRTSLHRTYDRAVA